MVKYELRLKSFVLKAWKHELKFLSESSDPRVTSSNLRVKSSNPRITKWNPQVQESLNQWKLISSEQPFKRAK